MNQRTLLAAVWLAVAATAQAARFQMAHLPQGWTGEIEVAECSETECTGEGSVTLWHNRHSHVLPAVFPVFATPPALGAALPDNPIEWADFNFDGLLDVAVPRGQVGPYGSWASDIYVQTASGRLVKSEALSELSDSYIGMPEIDRRRKLLIVSGKSGAAIHYTEHYRVLPQQGLQSVYQRTEVDGGCRQDTGIKVEERAMLPSGKWRERNRCLTEAQYKRLMQQDIAEIERRRRYDAAHPY